MGGRKSPFPITLAIGLYNSLYYRTSRDYIHILHIFPGGVFSPFGGGTCLHNGMTNAYVQCWQGMTNAYVKCWRKWAWVGIILPTFLSTPIVKPIRWKICPVLGQNLTVLGNKLGCNIKFKLYNPQKPHHCVILPLLSYRAWKSINRSGECNIPPLAHLRQH